MKIAIVVHGRFHAFDLASALLARGHDVTLFTNYPKWAVKPFDFPTNRVRSFALHGLISKTLYHLHAHALWFEAERWLHPVFGRWVASQLAREQWDAVHTWSGVSEEILEHLPSPCTLKLVMRGSAHIRTQSRLLEEEGRRAGRQIDRPGSWIIAREEREYRKVDRIVVLSTFAYASFVQEGIVPSTVRTLPLGASAAAFRPDSEVIEARCRRIQSGEPLRVLYVGAITLRKGFLDVVKIVRDLSQKQFRFRFVGPVTADAKSIVGELRRDVEFVSKQPQRDLPRWYAWGDVFLFPTIEDGFAAVLAQADASGLPILTTTNCCGPDLVKEGATGWVLPIRNPDAFVDRLRWCDTHRDALAGIVRNSYYNFRPRDWADVAADFESLCDEEVAKKHHSLVAFHGK